MKPAIIASLVFSFVRAMTAISAVIFLVSANYDLATSYILGRLENNDYGLAIVYSSVLIIVVMLVTIFIMHLVVGKRKLGRRDQAIKVLIRLARMMKKIEVKFENMTKEFNETVAVDNVSCVFEAGNSLP